MKLTSKTKSVAVVFAYSILAKLIVCYSQSYPEFMGEVCLITFPVGLMMFTWMCIDTYKSDSYKAFQIALTILCGTLIITVPIRICDFHGTIGSLPQEILGIIGIFAGWLLACKRKIWLLLLLLAVFILIAEMLPYWLDGDLVLPQARR